MIRKDCQQNGWQNKQTSRGANGAAAKGRSKRVHNNRPDWIECVMIPYNSGMPARKKVVRTPVLAAFRTTKGGEICRNNRQQSAYGAQRLEITVQTPPKAALSKGAGCLLQDVARCCCVLPTVCKWVRLRHVLFAYAFSCAQANNVTTVLQLCDSRAAAVQAMLFARFRRAPDLDVQADWRPDCP